MHCPHGQSLDSCPACLDASRVGTDEDLAATLLRADSTPTPASSTLPTETPQRIGRFIVLEVRGVGGMGVVYLAYDPALDRRVAIKVLRASPGGSQNSGGTTRLVREAQAMAQLSSPHVVPIYDVGAVGQSVFIAMEFIAGQTLQQWLTEKPRTWREALDVLLDAGRGLEAAHRAGLVHRDFKPANVLIGPDGRARVTDFGLARSNRHHESAEPAAPLTPAPVVSIDTPLTAVGAVMGTPGYMAPEQYVGAPTSAASDQFSFAVALHEALYGVRPFIADDLPTLSTLTQRGLPASPPRERKVPVWLWPILVRALAPTPAARYPSMRELLSALDADPSRARRRWALAGGGATLLAVTAALMVSLPRLRAKECEARTDRLAEVWGPQARAAAESAFLSNRQQWARTVWDNTRAQMDGFLAGWKAQRLEACEAHFLRGEQTETQLALRLSCLDRRWTELSTLAATFAAADGAIIAEGAIAVQRLTPVSTCANARALEARARLPADAQQLVNGVEQQLAEGRMLVALGRFDVGRARLEAAVTEARRLGNAETLGRALLELAILDRATMHFAAARLGLDEATRAALASADDATAVHALAVQTSVVGWHLEQPAEALALANVARGLLLRLPKDVRLEALLDQAEGDAHWLAADTSASLAAYQRSLAGLLTLNVADDDDVSQLQASIAWLLMEQGALDASRREFDRARQTRERLLGSDNPRLAGLRANIGELELASGDFTRALESYEHAREVYLRSRGPTSDSTRSAELHVILVLVRLNRVAEAVARMVRLEAGLGQGLQTPAAQLELREVRTELAMARGDFRGAVPLARDALERCETTLKPMHPACAANLVRLARALVGAGEAEKALAAGTDAVKRFGQHPTTARTRWYVEALALRRDALAALDQQTEALVAAEQVVSALEVIEANDALKVNAALRLADARWRSTAEHPRAIASAQKALELAQAANEPTLLTEVQTWLQTHRPR